MHSATPCSLGVLYTRSSPMRTQSHNSSNSLSIHEQRVQDFGSSLSHTVAGRIRIIFSFSRTLFASYPVSPKPRYVFSLILALFKPPTRSWAQTPSQFIDSIRTFLSLVFSRHVVGMFSLRNTLPIIQLF